LNAFTADIACDEDVAAGLLIRRIPTDDDPAAALRSITAFLLQRTSAGCFNVPPTNRFSKRGGITDGEWQYLVCATKRLRPANVLLPAGCRSAGRCFIDFLHTSASLSSLSLWRWFHFFGGFAIQDSAACREPGMAFWP
jgi:hypothetical protein